jgi:hypothetical protein
LNLNAGSYYYTHDNFFSYGGGGLKNDFQGHDNVWEGNAVMFIDQYCIHNGYGGPMDPVLPGHEQVLVGNLCVVNHDQDYGLPQCTGDDKSVMANNTVYSPTGNVTECGMPLAQWQAQGNDQGTTAHAFADGDLPGLAIAWARAKIFRRN